MFDEILQGRAQAAIASLSLSTPTVPFQAQLRVLDLFTVITLGARALQHLRPHFISLLGNNVAVLGQIVYGILAVLPISSGRSWRNGQAL